MMRTDEAVKMFGTQKALADAIGVSHSAVYKWGELVPASRVQSVRMAMRERAEQMEAEAVLLRAASKEV